MLAYLTVLHSKPSRPPQNRAELSPLHEELAKSYFLCLFAVPLAQIATCCSLLWSVGSDCWWQKTGVCAPAVRLVNLFVLSLPPQNYCTALTDILKFFFSISFYRIVIFAYFFSSTCTHFISF